jgi:hypothetical protein
MPPEETAGTPGTAGSTSAAGSSGSSGTVNSTNTGGAPPAVVGCNENYTACMSDNPSREFRVKTPIPDVVEITISEDGQEADIADELSGCNTKVVLQQGDCGLSLLDSAMAAVSCWGNTSDLVDLSTLCFGDECEENPAAGERLVISQQAAGTNTTVVMFVPRDHLFVMVGADAESLGEGDDADSVPLSRGRMIAEVACPFDQNVMEVAPPEFSVRDIIETVSL